MSIIYHLGYSWKQLPKSPLALLLQGPPALQLSNCAQKSEQVAIYIIVHSYSTSHTSQCQNIAVIKILTSFDLEEAGLLKEPLCDNLIWISISMLRASSPSIQPARGT